MKLILIFIVITISGCAHNFETRPFNVEMDSGSISGIKYYEPKLFKVSYTFTTLIDKNGSVIGTTDAGCTAVIQKEELIVLPDYSNPRVIINKPSKFSSGKLGLTLDKGMLTAINAENSPVAGAVVGALATIGAAAVAALVPGPDPACNSSPIISKVIPAG